jgi:hypothetical protein
MVNLKYFSIPIITIKQLALLKMVIPLHQEHLIIQLIQQFILVHKITSILLINKLFWFINMLKVQLDHYIQHIHFH